MPISAARQAISAILLNVGKRSCQRMTSLIGGNSRASTFRPWVVATSGGFEARIGQGHGDVLELPDEEPEMRDDDGRSEGGQAKSTRRRGPAKTARKIRPRRSRYPKRTAPSITVQRDPDRPRRSAPAARAKLASTRPMPYIDDQAPAAPQITPQTAISSGAASTPRLMRSRDTSTSGAGPSRWSAEQVEVARRRHGAASSVVRSAAGTPVRPARASRSAWWRSIWAS